MSNGAMIAGHIDEALVKEWIEGIDYNHLQPFTYRFKPDGRREMLCLQPEQLWTEIRGNDENRDYEVKYPGEGPEIPPHSHEVKAQYSAFADNPGTRLKTGNICIEIDEGCVAYEPKSKDLIRKHIHERGWFHSGDGKDDRGNPYHAEWYHHYLPTFKRDYNHIVSDNATKSLTEEEQEKYLAGIEEGNRLITSVPGGLILSMSAAKTREVLEKCGFLFDDAGERTSEKINVMVPVSMIIEQFVDDCKTGNYDEQIALTPVPEYKIKGTDSREPRYFMPKELIEAIRNIEGIGDELVAKVVKAAEEQALHTIMNGPRGEQKKAHMVYNSIKEAEAFNMPISGVAMSKDKEALGKTYGICRPNGRHYEEPFDPYIFYCYVPTVQPQKQRGSI